MRELEDAEVDFGEDGEDVVADVGNNADLYTANHNQESTDLINEAHMEEAPLCFTMGHQGQDVFYILHFTFTFTITISITITSRLASLD